MDVRIPRNVANVCNKFDKPEIVSVKRVAYGDVLNVSVSDNQQSSMFTNMSITDMFHIAVEQFDCPCVSYKK